MLRRDLLMLPPSFVSSSSVECSLVQRCKSTTAISDWRPYLTRAPAVDAISLS